MPKCNVGEVGSVGDVGEVGNVGTVGSVGDVGTVGNVGSSAPRDGRGGPGRAPKGTGAGPGRVGHGHLGRRPTTNRRELERVAVALFAERGFDRTTVEDIARAAGIGRRTFFRYFESKNDVIWGEFDEQLARMREAFATLPDDVALMEGIIRVVVEVNRYGPDDLTDLRRRMTLIASNPALQAHSTLRYDAWRGAVAEFVARRLGQGAGDLVPATIAGATLGVATAAYAYWLGHDAHAEPSDLPGLAHAEPSDLPGLLRSALQGLSQGFGGLVVAPDTDRGADRGTGRE